MTMHLRMRTVGSDLGAAWDGSGEAMFETPIVRNAHFHHEAMTMHMRTRTVGCDLGSARGWLWEGIFATPMVRNAHFEKERAQHRRSTTAAPPQHHRSTTAAPAHLRLQNQPPDGGEECLLISSRDGVGWGQARYERQCK